MCLAGTAITVNATNTPVGMTLKTTLFTGFPAAAVTYALVHTFTCTAASGTFTLSGLAAATVTSATLVFNSLAPVPGF